jgi:uncharacterized protein YukE
MEKNQAINNIKETLKKLLQFSKEVTKFGTLELTDGTKVTTTSSDLQVGDEIYQLDDMGNQSPLSDGDYVLTDGRTFTVSGNSIESIGDGEDESDDSTETPTDLENKKMDSNLPDGHDDSVAQSKGEDVPSEVMSRLDDLEKSIEDIKSLLDKITSVQNDVNSQMMSKLERFGKEPGDKAIKSVKKESFSYDKKNPKEINFENIKSFVKDFSNENNTLSNNISFTKIR